MASTNRQSRDLSLPFEAINLLAGLLAPKMSAVGREHARVPGRVEGDHIVWRDSAARHFHSRRAGWHPRRRDAEHLGMRLEQPRDVGHRHVAFDQITVHGTGVTGAQRRRHAAVRGTVRRFGDGRLEAGSSQVRHPVQAAAAAGIAYNADGRRLRVLRAQRGDGGERSEEAGGKGESLHPFILSRSAGPCVVVSIMGPYSGWILTLR
jgi:hypothetical protein